MRLVLDIYNSEFGALTLIVVAWHFPEYVLIAIQRNSNHSPRLSTTVNNCVRVERLPFGHYIFSLTFLFNENPFAKYKKGRSFF